MTEHYDIEIRLVGDEAVPDPVRYFDLDDTVRYFSNDGEVSVEFAATSPFEALTVGNRETVVVKNLGDFRCKCFITKDGDPHRFGWKGEPSASGGDHSVPKPK